MIVRNVIDVRDGGGRQQRLYRERPNRRVAPTLRPHHSRGINGVKKVSVRARAQKVKVHELKVVELKEYAVLGKGIIGAR